MLGSFEDKTPSKAGCHLIHSAVREELVASLPQEGVILFLPETQCKRHDASHLSFGVLLRFLKRSF